MTAELLELKIKEIKDKLLESRIDIKISTYVDATKDTKLFYSLGYWFNNDNILTCATGCGKEYNTDEAKMKLDLLIELFTLLRKSRDIDQDSIYF